MASSTPQEAADKFKAIAARLRDLTPASQVVAEKTKEFIQQRFDQAKDVSGSPFQPLSDTTLKIDPSRFGGRPLTKSSNLQNTISVSAHSSGIELSVPAPYANAQNYGNPNNRVFGGARGPIPARKFLPFNRDMTLDGSGEAGAHWEEMQEILLTYILDGEI